jgi:hypothetical protein
MNPLYLQLFGVIAVILILGSLGMLRAMAERLDRETRSFPGRMEMPGPLDAEALRSEADEALRLAEEIRRLRARAEHTAQHDLERK